MSKPFVNCKYGTPECRCCHATDYGACGDFLSQTGMPEGEKSMCVYCDHHEKCHAFHDPQSYNTP